MIYNDLSVRRILITNPNDPAYETESSTFIFAALTFSNGLHGYL